MTTEHRPHVMTLTQSTSVSIAVVVSLCFGAFWTGIETATLRSRADGQDHEIQQHERLLEKLTEISSDNKRRIDLIEAKR